MNSPNNLELVFESLLRLLFFGQYKFVGNGKVIIAGKCPDFINMSGQKIIEIYGDWWHKGQNPQKRVNTFREYGFKTLVLWEHEFNDLKTLVEKVTEFNYG
jgi:very-short-patch-repair endonuclease